MNSKGRQGVPHLQLDHGMTGGKGLFAKAKNQIILALYINKKQCMYVFPIVD